MSKSIYKKLITDMTAVIIIPIMAVIAIICVILCMTYYNDRYAQASIYVEDYAERIRNEMELCEDKSESILKYTYIINNLTRDYKDNYERLEVTMNVAAYLESVMGENVTVYISGSGVFQSKYILPLVTLENNEEIYRKIHSTGTNLYWDEEIYSDSKGEYLLLYREMTFNKNSLMVCKAYIPETAADEYKISMVKKSDAENFDISKEIKADFYAVGSLNRKMINMMWLIYIFLFISLGILFAFALATFTKRAVKKTTIDIENFIVKLKNQDITSTDFEAELNPGDFTELAVIKKTVSSLARHIREISYMKYETELERKKLQLELLQNRIDPHLLYNSLTVIKLNAIKADDKKTVDVVDNLVSYYRAVLAKGKDYVSISDEIEMLKKYVNINSVFNDKKYTFVTDIPDELKDKQILHLMLQPFLENSIVHGLSGRRENCRAEIKCRQENGFLVFNIDDNGYGISEKILAKLNNLDEYTGSYGIKNVYMRLKLEYGDKSEIKIDSVKNEYTHVTIKIPYE